MNRTTTLILVVVFAALLLYVLLVQRPADEAATNATPTAAPGTARSGPLWAGVTADQILSIRIEDRAQSRVLAFGRADATAAWAITEPDPGPADQVASAGNAATLVSLPYQNALTPTIDLNSFGVISPTYVIDVGLVGGTSARLSVGDKTPTGDAYYAQKDGDPAVYVINGFSLDQIVGWLNSPPFPPTATPEVTITPSESATPTP